VGEEDQKKASSIWKYLSVQQTHENLGIDIPKKASTVLPDETTLSIAFDICRKSYFEKEAIAVWKYGKENENIVLDSNVLDSYVGALAAFRVKRAADFPDKVIRVGV
jgi:hypothetical protein